MHSLRLNLFNLIYYLLHEKVIDYLDDGSQNLFLFAYRRETVYGSIDFDDTILFFLYMREKVLLGIIIREFF